MDIETRLTNLENLVNALIKRIDNDKFYTDADTQGIRKSVSDVTPYTASKTAYIGDTEVVFENVPAGNISVYSDIDIESVDWHRSERGLIVDFGEPLEEVIKITISIS